ncbi:MAG: hypothetical protein JST01_13985 [Cyanobacteria bacterium SZAS TMP-1]|nr:hypothetical protein [Cyanobacteria bacterium SZAS TMP-1]
MWLDVLALILLLTLNWVCYVRVINGYFLADDFLHVAYLKRVFDGDWFSLLRNFWGNWMQAQGTTFYRPLISISLALDYFLYGPNAAGFHISNLFFQTASTLLLYLVARDMFKLFAPSAHNQTRLGALACASFFAVSPLHCEVVAWIISRVDSVACMFYLASLALFLAALHKEKNTDKHQGRLKAARTGSLLMFAAGLGSKEMTIVLPATIFLLLLLTGEEVGLRKKFFHAFKLSLPFWLMLGGYMVLRTLALGTISGGYQGSIGEGLSNSLTKRWLQDGSLTRVLFPLNLDVFGNGHALLKTLRLLYILAAANFALALLTARQKMPAIKALLFGGGWLVLTLLPTYQVWNLTETLQGSRFIYFGTMPLAFILATLVMPPLTAGKAALTRLFLPLRLALLTALIIVLATITTKNNQPWQRAMKELKSFQAAVCHLADQQSGKNILLLNIPQSYRGAHMLYNGATMSVMLTPPLATKSIVDQIYTFEPATYGDADLIDASRLRRLMAAPANLLYLWDRDKFSLEPVLLKSASGEKPEAEQILFPAADGKPVLRLAPGAVALSPEIGKPALNIDAIKVELTAASKAKIADDNAVLQLSYPGGTMTLPLAKAIKTSSDGAVVFQLSEHKNWLKQGLVKKLTLEASGITEPIEIKKISALNIAGQQPLLQADARDLTEGPDGICRVRGARPSFSYDVSGVAGAVGALCEVSKPDSWFEHYSGTLRDTMPSENALHVVPFNRTKGRNILLSFAGLKDHGFYQIKIAAVDKDGKVIGYFSDPLNFQI